ncbi:cocaine esterase-like [Babylonia areolata]|uniref:cocaine esterase-like n=1 Tax=Babylonia areolata TaxID=304850 RepID=UPI003FD405D6
MIGAVTEIMTRISKSRNAFVSFRNTVWQNGTILGTDGTSPGGVPYSVYRAIPYALPPLEDRRFAKPVPHPGPGVGRVFNATSPGYVCPQKVTDDSLKKLQNEDCLTLNVYVSTSATTGPKSVMIWIHGGGFVQGSALDYIPSELVTTKDVIVVVIQYRLDILGFLSSGDDVIPGNYGLWDQALAIKWVKDNIQAFGGDPNEITLFGQSAGAASVGYQMLSPVNKGINFKVISQSGTPLAPWAFIKDPHNVFQVLANRTGCMAASSLVDRMYYMVAGGRQKAEHESILKCLRGKEVATLLNAIDVLPDADLVTQKLWIPTADGEFVPRDPNVLMRDVAYLADVGATTRDVMVGVNNEEGGALFDQNMFKLDDNLMRVVLTQEVLFRNGEGLRKETQRLKTLVDVLDFFYAGSLNGRDFKEQSVVDTFSDIYSVIPTVMFMRDLTKASDELRSDGRPSGGRHYLYLFNRYPASRAGLSRGRGSYHGDDLAYEFDRVGIFAAGVPFESDDLSLATTFKSMITNFARTGTPQLNLNQQDGSTWPEFTLSGEQYLSLDFVPRVDANLYSKRVALWLDLIPSMVNSTRGINMGSWAMPWQQQQMYSPNGYGTYNYNLMNRLPMRFVFNGRISFYKLQ